MQHLRVETSALSNTHNISKIKGENKRMKAAIIKLILLCLNILFVSQKKITQLQSDLNETVYHFKST